MFFTFIGLSHPILLKSMKERMQAFHIDNPNPNIYVNALYLDDGPGTHFLVPKKHGPYVLSVPKVPLESSLLDDISSNDWEDYLKERFC